MLVVSEQLVWGLPLRAHLVVIMDTVKYDGREKVRGTFEQLHALVVSLPRACVLAIQQRFVDYPIHDMLQIMGLASRPGQDASGKCVLLCPNSKKVRSLCFVCKYACRSNIYICLCRK